MPREPAKRIIVSGGSELARILAEARAMPVVLEKDGELYRLEHLEEEPADIFAGYDPQKVREALVNYAGSWAHLDTDKMTKEIYAARQQGSRPTDHP